MESSQDLTGAKESASELIHVVAGQPVSCWLLVWDLHSSSCGPLWKPPECLMTNCSWEAGKWCEREQGRERERETKTEGIVFYNLFLDVIYHPFHHTLLVAQNNLDTMWEGPHKGMNIKGQRSLGAVLEASNCSSHERPFLKADLEKGS